MVRAVWARAVKYAGIPGSPDDSAAMNQGLDHLPEGKRRELDFVVAVIREGFAKAIAHRTQPRFRTGTLFKIILFGSYARGKLGDRSDRAIPRIMICWWWSIMRI